MKAEGEISQEEQRIILLLLEGAAVEEIAKEVKISEAAVQSAVKRLRIDGVEKVIRGLPDLKGFEEILNPRKD